MEATGDVGGLFPLTSPFCWVRERTPKRGEVPPNMAERGQKKSARFRPTCGNGSESGRHIARAVPAPPRVQSRETAPLSHVSLSAGVSQQRNLSSP